MSKVVEGGRLEGKDPRRSEVVPGKTRNGDGALRTTRAPPVASEHTGEPTVSRERVQELCGVGRLEGSLGPREPER